ncbi:MAG: zinc-dependent alcohol dehydrogenase family protein [Methylococcales bacterium]|nr:zinc-dependent alcohol dehydrogenase family protein [Methylococcales bacterium]
MKAILMTDKGSVEVLQLADIAEPEIMTATEVKIRIKAVGVNPIDTKVRSNGGFYQQIFPIVLGCDGSGEIVEVAEGVSQYKVGDEVWYCHGGLGNEQGSYAEYTVVDNRWLSLKPNNISFVEAAAMPLVLITAWNALFEKGDLQPEQTVLIHAGAGGVGHVAIQLAKLHGAQVITTVSSEEKADFVKSLGADHAVIYTETGFVNEVKRLTHNQGVDLVIDTVGGDVFKQSIAITAYFGRLITLLDPGDVVLAEARMRNLLIGFELMLTPMLKGLDDARDKHVIILQRCKQWLERGDLKVHIADVFPLQQAMMAHKKIEQGHVSGKIVLEI